MWLYACPKVEYALYATLGQASSYEKLVAVRDGAQAGAANITSRCDALEFAGGDTHTITIA